MAKDNKKEKDDDNIVFIGSKPFMNYIQAVQTQLINSDEVTLKARGKFIARTVDVAEAMKNRFAKNVKIDNIKTSTAKYKNKEEKEVNVSEIEIVLKK